MALTTKVKKKQVGGAVGGTTYAPMPLKPPAPKPPLGVGGPGTASISSVQGANAPTAPKSTFQQGVPAAPAPAAVQPSGLPSGIVDTSAAAPQSTQGYNTRMDAGSDFGALLPTLNAQLASTAEDYGGVDKYTQYGWTPYAYGAAPGTADLDTTSQVDYVDNPNSQLNVLRRNLTDANTAQDVTAGNANSFWSGANQEAHQKLGDTENRGELGAQEAYNQAVAALHAQLTGGITSREKSYRDALEQDKAAATAVTPSGTPVLTPEQAAYITHALAAQNGAGAGASGAQAVAAAPPRLEAGPVNSTGSRGTAPGTSLTQKGQYAAAASGTAAGKATGTGAGYSAGSALASALKKKKK